MKPNTLLKTGIIGFILAALCCFTPILVVLFGALGLTFLVGYSDYALLPSLAVFLGITAYAFFIKKEK